MLKTGKITTRKHKSRILLEDIAEVAGTTHTAVLKASSRKLFNHRDLQSIVRYITQTRKKKKLPELS